MHAGWSQIIGSITKINLKNPILKKNSCFTPSPNFRTTPAEGRLTPMYDKLATAQCMTDLQLNQVLDTSVPKAETLPLDYCGSKFVCHHLRFGKFLLEAFLNN
ncbi:hypothetical protein AVEN_28239-1 [Araneus ventricosus]|uniref:Uncharacterized protein n=1 Tax=Araneus ventricosus TaxID=182803 RepID=A0A4Y2L5A5_ARAVE|nr:hypothetical protein AVEN_28239-1 [Araneus ventricosus]